MSWEKGRPEGWENTKDSLIGLGANDQEKKDRYFEAGADAMHKADLQFLREFPDLVRMMQAHMTKQQWFDFIGKET